MLVLTLLLNLFVSPHRGPEIIEGYVNKPSAYPGDSIDVYLNASFYQEGHPLTLTDLCGNTAHTFVSTVFPQSVRSDRAYELGFGFRRTCRIAVPALASGIYLIENKIPLIIKSREAKINIVYPSNTNNAYCAAGGKSLYGFNSTEKKAAHIVSFHRPMDLPRHAEAFFKWAHEQNLADVGYITDADLEDHNSISNSKLIIIAGHSEYWTLQARRNFDRFVQNGKHAMVLSGNTMWWQVRYSKKKDQLICYRDARLDPVKNNKLKTINWFEPSLNYPIITSIGAEFRNGGYGLRFNDGGWDGYKIISNSPLLEGTSLKVNDVIKCPSDEMDGAPLSAFVDGRPLVDYQKAGFSRIEIVGYDKVQRAGNEGIATWIVFKPTSTSGIVINTGSTDWCSSRGIGNNADIGIITMTMIRKLMNDENVFTIDPSENIIAN